MATIHHLPPLAAGLCLLMGWQRGRMTMPDCRAGSTFHALVDACNAAHDAEREARKLAEWREMERSTAHFDRMLRQDRMRRQEQQDECSHEWSYTGTAYGGDDDSYHGEGRCFCIHCGADGDA